jgi:hypothetical protein
MKKRIILTAVLIGSIALDGLSFCGFYVAKADTKLFNKTSQVIMVRDGNKTTVTMSNDFQGDVKDFAMVVPVPSVLKREDIRVVQPGLFSKLDEYSGPRLVEYYDQDPCMRYDMDKRYKSADNFSTSVTLNEDFVDEASNLGVTIEAKYDIEEYEVLILSAKESNGLSKWLTANGYKIPQDAEDVLEPYIKNDMKFFVVKVNVEKLDEIQGISNVKKYIDVPEGTSRTLRPLQITYESDKFMLPIRLGMANANGEQDMIVYAFTRKGRVECTNYRTAKIPTNKNIPLFVKNKFGKFYVDLFEKAHAQADKEAIFLEYAWDVSPLQSGVKCDPCVGPPPIFADFKEAGVDWNINSAQSGNGVFFTRLHVRYSRETHPQDLQFHVTPNTERFQARYILTNPAGGDLKCDQGQIYCAKKVKERAEELETLKELTSWNTTQYKSYVTEFYDKLDDPTLIYKIEGDSKEEFAPTVFPGDTNDPNKGLKIGILSSILGLMLLMFFVNSRKKMVLKFKPLYT